MQQVDPNTIGKLLATDNKDNELMQAMAAGKQQAEREKIIEQQRQIKERNQGRTKGR